MQGPTPGRPRVRSTAQVEKRSVRTRDDDGGLLGRGATEQPFDRVLQTDQHRHQPVLRADLAAHLVETSWVELVNVVSETYFSALTVGSGSSGVSGTPQR